MIKDMKKMELNVADDMKAWSRNTEKAKRFTFGVVDDDDGR